MKLTNKYVRVEFDPPEFTPTTGVNRSDPVVITFPPKQQLIITKEEFWGLWLIMASVFGE